MRLYAQNFYIFWEKILTVFSQQKSLQREQTPYKIRLILFKTKFVQKLTCLSAWLVAVSLVSLNKSYHCVLAILQKT
jgi:hypothetical protein